MDENTRKAIESGQPMTIIHVDKEGNVTSKESYNLDNVSLSKFQKEQLAKALLEACKKYFNDPENVKKYEEWKAENDKENIT